MNVQTIEFDASTPIQKQITVPTNSDFAVGIKVYRDGEVVDVKRHELSVNGQIASDQRNGYNIFELSSDSNVGMKRLEFDVDKKSTVSQNIYSVYDKQKKKTSSLQIAAISYLSGRGLPETLTLKTSDIDWIGPVSAQISSADGWDDVQLCSAISMYLKNGSSTYAAKGQNATQWIVYQTSGIPTYEDTITINTNTDTVNSQLMFINGPVGWGYISSEISIDTHDGFQANIPLQVSQTDLGYIERKNPLKPFSIYSSATEVEAHGLQSKFQGQPVLNVSMPELVTVGAYGMKDAFKDCKQLTTVDFSKLSAVGTDGLDGTFDGCTSLEIVLFQSSEAIPTITSTTFANTNDTFKVIVPDALYEDWIVDESWASLSSHVTKVSDYAAVMTNYGGYDNMDDNN